MVAEEEIASDESALVVAGDVTEDTVAVDVVGADDSDEEWIIRKA